MVKLRKFLRQLMYHDRCNVYRAVENRTGWKSENARDFETVYENIECALHQYGKELSAHRDDRTQEISINLRLCCNPDIEILENDVVEVTRAGQTFKLIAGTAFNYPTHKEISLRRHKEARQS